VVGFARHKIFISISIKNDLHQNIKAMETKTIENSIKDIKKATSKINPAHKEGPVARAIENQTAKLPSDTFLWISLSAMAGALTLKLLKKDHLALFVGQWAAPFLMFGIYDKLVKLEGHDKTDRGKTHGRK
jgi:hypothetical protein